MRYKVLVLSIYNTYKDKPKDELGYSYEEPVPFTDRATSGQNSFTSLLNFLAQLLGNPVASCHQTPNPLLDPTTTPTLSPVYCIKDRYRHLP